MIRENRAHVTDAKARAGGATLIIVALVAALVIALHVTVRVKGSHWTSFVLHGEMLFTIAFTLTIFIYALALGRRLAGPHANLVEDGLIDMLASIGIGFSLLTTAILIAGFLRLYYAPLFLLAFAGLTIVLRADLMAILRISEAGIRNWKAQGTPSAPRLGQRLLLVILAITAVHVLTRASLPLTDWDALAYHLSALKIYLMHHAILPLPDMPLANAPSAEEMLFLTGLMAGTDSLGKMLNVGFALLLGLAVYALARQLSGKISGWYAAILLFSSVWIVTLLPVTLTDFASAFLLVVAVSDAATWANRYAASGLKMPPGRVGARLAIRSGLLAGSAAACKLSTLPLLPALVGSLGAFAFLYGGPDVARRLGGAGKIALVSGTAALAPLAPWLLKNVYFFGSPLYPYGKIAVSNESHGVTIAAITSAPADHARWLVSTFVDLMLSRASLLTVLLIAGVIILHAPAQRFVLIVLASLVVLWLLYVPYFDPPRYYVGIVALAQALSVAMSFELCKLARVPPRFVAICMTAYLLYRAVPTMLAALALMAGTDLSYVTRGNVSYYEYVAARVRPYLAEMWVNQHEPGTRNVAMVNVITGYYLDVPYLNDWYGLRLANLQISPRTRTEELALWCRAGVRFVIFDRGNGSPEFRGTNNVRPLSDFAWTRLHGLHAGVVYSANGVDVLALHPCSARSQGGQQGR